MSLNIIYFVVFSKSCDSIVVSTLRCGRKNPGSNPGHSRIFFFFRYLFFMNIFTVVVY